MNGAPTDRLEALAIPEGARGSSSHLAANTCASECRWALSAASVKVFCTEAGRPRHSSSVHGSRLAGVVPVLDAPPPPLSGPNDDGGGVGSLERALPGVGIREAVPAGLQHRARK